MMRHLYCERGTKASTQKGKAVRLVNINSKFDRRQSGNWMHGYPPLTKVSLCYFSCLLLRAFKRSDSRLQKKSHLNVLNMWKRSLLHRCSPHTGFPSTQTHHRAFQTSDCQAVIQGCWTSLHKPVCASHRQRSTNSKTSDSLPLSEPVIQFKEQREVC